MYPIILFVYNKPAATLQTLKALEKNLDASESDIFIFSDGPKVNPTMKDANANIEKVREIIRDKYNFKSCTIIESPTNKGLAKSVIAGVSEVLKSHEAVIIVEDDVLTSRYFIQFMNQQLDHYKNDERVFSIGSWNYFFKNARTNFFFRVPDSIAWAVYNRSWKKFEPDSNKLIRQIEGQMKINEFNLDNSYDFFNMLHMQVENKVDSWAIRWYATCFLNSALCLYPNVSLTKHIGYGEGAAHLTDPVDVYKQSFEVENNSPVITKIQVSESKPGVNSYIKFHKAEPPFFRKAISSIRRYISFK